MNRFLKISISAFLVVNILSSVRGLFQIHYLSKILTVLFIAVIGYEFFKGRVKPEPKQLRFLLLLLLFPAWALITSFWSIRPDITALASINYLVMVLVFFGLGFLWMKYNSNENFLILFLPANIVVLAIALFSIITNIPADSWSGGHGRGLMSFWGWQNSLAMAALFTLPGVFSLVNSEQTLRQAQGDKANRDQQSHWWSLGHSLFNDKRQLLFFLLLSLNFFLIMLTYSRAAMLAVFVGVVCYLVLNKNYKILASGFLLIAIITLLAVTVKPINTNVYKVLAKHDMPIFTTREILWGPSLEAAKNNFLFGTGYTMTDQTVKGITSRLEVTTGLYAREKGNSYLALIEETGIVGFTFFMIPIFYLFIYLCKGRNSNIILLNCLIVALLFHALFEAWFYGSGTFFRFFLLLVIFSFIKLISINKIKNVSSA